MKTILDIIHDHHAPYPCRYCGRLAEPMSLTGVEPAGVRFIRENYLDGFYIQSCVCMDQKIDEMEAKKKLEEQARIERAYIMGERAAISDEEWGGVRKKRKGKTDVSFP